MVEDLQMGVNAVSAAYWSAPPYLLAQFTFLYHSGFPTQTRELPTVCWALSHQSLIMASSYKFVY